MNVFNCFILVDRVGRTMTLSWISIIYCVAVISNKVVIKSIIFTVLSIKNGSSYWHQQVDDASAAKQNLAMQVIK